MNNTSTCPDIDLTFSNAPTDQEQRIHSGGDGGTWGAVAEWVRALAWAGDRTVSRPGSNPATVTSLRNFGNSVYPALPVSFGGDTKKPSVPSIWCLCQGK